MILSSGCDVAKVKSAVFGEASTKRRPRTSWMAKPSAHAPHANIPVAPAIPAFGGRAEPGASVYPTKDDASPLTEPSTLAAQAHFTAASDHVEKLAVPAVIIDAGPSAAEIARTVVLDQRERQL